MSEAKVMLKIAAGVCIGVVIVFGILPALLLLCDAGLSAIAKHFGVAF